MVNQSIQNFYRVAADRDFSRDFLFRLTQMQLQGVPALTENELVYVKTAALPGRAISNIPVPYMGLDFNIPGSVKYTGSEAYNLTFFLDANSQLRNYFEGASRALFDDTTSTGEYGTPDDDFFIQFIVFLRNEYNLNDNTLHRNLNYFKTFLNWCIKKGFEVPKDFKNINVQPYETDDIALTEADLDTLAGLELDGKLELTRDLFLIGCYSGQRYSDYSVFEKDDIQEDMIIKRAEKTETNSFIPLHPKLIRILDKYDWEIKTTSSQKFNQHIQTICKMAGFNEIIKNTIYKGSQKEVIKKQRWEMIGSHTARRTFITIAAEKMMPDHIIMAITGIRDPKTLNKYKKVNKQSIKDSAFNVFS